MSTMTLEPQSRFLRAVADEIRKEGHAGWGNTCEQAADAIGAHLRERETFNSLRVEDDRIVTDREKLHSSPEYLSQVNAAKELRRLRERESAKAVVTDDLAGRFHDDLMARDGGVRRWAQMGGRQREAWRQTLEAVAPMLASARVPDDAEAVCACLGDDAAAMLDFNPDDERALNMQRAAQIIDAMLTAAPRREEG